MLVTDWHVTIVLFCHQHPNIVIIPIIKFNQILIFRKFVKKYAQYFPWEVSQNWVFETQIVIRSHIFKKISETGWVVNFDPSSAIQHIRLQS